MNKKLILAGMVVPSIILGVEATNTLNLENENNNVKAVEAVHFEDKDLQAVINMRYLDVTGEEAWKTPITVEQMANLPIALELSDFGVDSLVGLEYAVNVQQLNVSNNNITDISPLKDLKKITDLNVASNQIDIDSDEFKTILRGLVINKKEGTHHSEYTFGGNITNVEEYDLSFLKRPDITSIYSINLQFTPSIKKIKGLANINNITTISVSNNTVVNKPSTYLNRMDYEETETDFIFQLNSPNLTVKYGGKFAPNGSKSYKGTLKDGVYNYVVPKSTLYKGLNTFVMPTSNLHFLTVNLEDTAPNLNVDYKGDGLFSIEATDLDTGIDNIYYAKGNLDADYFKNPNNAKNIGKNFEDNVVDSNGIYTVYTVDGSGNVSLKTFEVNDFKEPEVTENVEISKKKVDVVLSVGEKVSNVTNFESDVLKELERLGVDTSLVNIEAMKTVETSTNATDAQEIFNNWEMFPYNYTGSPMWQYNATNKSITSPVDPHFETGFINKKDGMSSKFEMSVDINNVDIHLQALGMVFGMHPNEKDPSKTDLYYLWISGDKTHGNGVVGLFKVEGQNFDYSNRPNHSYRYDSYAALPLSAFENSYLGWVANIDLGGYKTGTKYTDRDYVTNLVDPNMRTKIVDLVTLEGSPLGWHNVQLSVDNNEFTVSYDNKEIMKVKDTENPYTSGYHGIFQYSNVNQEFKNMTIKNFVSKSISEVLGENSWSEGSEKIIVHMENENADYLNTEELTSKLLADNIHLITYGDEDNKDTLKNILENNNNKGLNLDIDEYDASIASTAKYIKDLLAVAPNEPVISASTSEPTNKDVVVSIDYHADTEFKKYKINDGEWLDYTEPVTISENTTIYAYGANADKKSDVVEYVVNNIDKENLDNVTITPDKSSPTNADVSVTLTSELGEEIYYSVNDGEFIKYETPVVFTDNGHIKAYSLDKAGNVSETKEYTVSNIDKIAPETPIVEQEVTELTNKPYGLQLLNQEDGANTLYKFNDNDWVSLDTDVLNISQNGEYSFKYADQAGNESEVTVLDVNNFDYEAEDFYLTKEEFNTHGDIYVNLSEDFNDKMYMLVGEEYTPLDTNKVQVYENGMYTFKSIDELGNEIIKDIEVNLINIISSIDNLDYETLINNPSVVDKLVENIENPKLNSPKDDEYYAYLMNHLAGLVQEELDILTGSGNPEITDVYKFATSGVLSSSDQINDGTGGFNNVYKLINSLPSGAGSHTLIDLGTGYLLLMEDCGEDYIGGLTINDILEGNSSPNYMKVINYIDGVPDTDTQNRLKDKLNAQIIKLIEDCLDDPTGSGIDIKDLAELCVEFGVLDSFGNFGSGSGSDSGSDGSSGAGGDSSSGGNFGSGSAQYIGGLIGGLTPDTLSVIGGQIIDYLQCGCLYIPDEELDRLKKEFDDKIVEIFNNELVKAKINPTDEGLEPLIEIIKCSCMPKETEDYLTGLLIEYLKELIANTGSLQELDKLEKFTTDNGIELTEEIEEQRAKIGLVESGGGLDTPEEDNEQPEITEDENIETDIIIPSDNGTNTNSNQVTETNKDLPQTGTEQGTNAGILLLVTGLLGGLLIRRKQDKQNKTE